MPRKNRRVEPPARPIRFIPLHHFRPAKKKAEVVRLAPAKSSDAAGNLAA